MASFSEAVKRLQIIYNECAPEDADGKKQTQRDLDDFGLAKKRLHKDVQEVREVCMICNSCSDHEISDSS